MEETDKKVENHRRGIVHFILVHSYFVFLFAIILGVLFDSFIDNKIFSNNIYQYIGFFMLIISSIIIYWAQESSANYKKREKKNTSRSHFEFGPYKYLRSPTHFGLFIMALGFSLIMNSFFGVVLTLIAYLITKILFLKKEEKILEKKYGQIYTDYKKKVKNWI